MARILIVEDEAANVEVADIICTAAGHHCVAVGNGEEALERLATQQFDMLLVDMLMPVMDGLTLVRQLRKQPRYANMPILGVTARASEKDQLAFFQAGVDEIVTKPYRSATLRDAVVRLLEDRTASRAPVPHTEERAI